MSNETDIFDLTDIEDLPGVVQKELRLLGLRNDTEKMLSLFEIKPQLTVDEILVGLKRKYNIQKTRGWISSTAYNLKRRDILRKADGKIPKYERV